MVLGWAIRLKASGTIDPLHSTDNSEVDDEDGSDSDWETVAKSEKEEDYNLGDINLEPVKILERLYFLKY